jgi:hypothetical protein
MSELRRLRERLKNCYLNGFFLDRNTFLKADGADLVMVSRREEDGRAAERPMIILKNVVEMTVDHRGKVVAVENKPELGVWVDALERSVERFNTGSLQV